MNFKTTYYIFGLLIFIVAIFALKQRGGTGTSAEEAVFPSLRAGKVTEKEVTRLEINRPGPPAEKLVFERADGTSPWRMIEPYKTRVDGGLIDNLVRDLLRLKRDEKASAQMPRDLASNGLAPPAATITFARGEQSYTLNLGNDTPGTGRKKLVCVVSSERPKEPLAIAHQEVETAYKSPKEFREKTLVLESVLNALGVTVNDGKNEVSLVKNEDPAKVNVWRFAKPEYGEADWEGEGTGNIPAGMPVQRVNSVRDLLVAIEQMKVDYNPEKKVDDFVADNVSEKDLADKYGLAKGKPATLRIEVKARPGGLLGGEEKKAPVTDALLIGKKVPKTEVKAELLPQPKVEPDGKDKPEPKEKPKEEKPAPDASAELLPQPKIEPEGADDEKYYARLESENNVVQISGKNIPIILAALADPSVIRNKDLATYDISKVDAIDIKTAAGTVKLRKLGDPAKWRLIEDGNIRDADASAVLTLNNMLTVRRQVKEFPTAPDEKLGLDDKSPTAEVTVWEDAIKDKKDVKADVALGKETVKLIFSTKPEKELVYVKRLKDKDAIRLAVAEKMLEFITPGKLGYIDKKLPLVKDDDEVTKIVVVRREDNTTFELVNEKEKPEDKVSVWKIKQPPAQAGRKADIVKLDPILFMARTLQPEKLIAEKASDKELADWGLKPALYEITVSAKKGDKTEDKVFLFGTQNEKKDGRYAKMSERDLVFLVRPEVIAPVEPKVKDLVDLQVLSFDASKVREVKLIGLADGAKPVTLDAEFKESKPGAAREWQVKNQAELKDFKLDPAKLTQFVGELSRLHASQFLIFKAGPKPEHKLGAKDRSLEIEIFLEGDEKKPLKLTLGAPVTEGETKGYAAQLDSLPGDVFVIPEARFAEVLKNGLKQFGK